MSLPQVTSNPLPQRKPKRAVKGQDAVSKDTAPNDGIYSNQPMVHSVMLLTGHQVDVELIDSSIWTGILRTVSPEMAIVLSVAHLKKNTKNKPCLLASHDAIRTHLVIPFGEVVTISATQVEIPHTDSFKTDTEIGALNGTSDRDLKPFTDFDDVTDNISTINETGGGWSVEDMISTNENRFNVKSTYTDDLQGYTTQLEQSDSPEYLLRKRRAEQLAQEIQDRDRHYNEGEDRATTEEDKYSSVVRPNAIGMSSPTPQSPSPTSQRQQDSGFVEQLGDVSSDPLVVANTQPTIKPNKADPQDPEPLDSSRDDVLEDLKNFSQNFQLCESNQVDKDPSQVAQPQVNDVTSTGTDMVPKSFKLNPLAEEFNPNTATAKTPSSPTTNNTYNTGGRRYSRGGRNYNQYFQQQQQQQQHSMLSTLPDYLATQQTYMASAFPVGQVMPVYQALSQQQQQQVFSANPYYDGMGQMIAVPHPQQAALMSQLPSNRQAMVPPTQPVYIIPQHQVTSGIPPAPSVAAAAAFQPTQFATLGSPQLSTQYMSPSSFQM